MLLDLRGAPCLVVGAGAVAARKIRGLLEVGAEVTVIAPGPLHHDVAARAGSFVWTDRPVAAGDVDRRWRFVVAATDDPSVNARVEAEATAAGVWVNNATTPDGGTAALPAVHRMGSVTVTASTGGVHPGAAVWLRDLAAEALGPEVGELLAMVGELSQTQAAQGSTTDRRDWRSILNSGTLELIREGRRAEAKERLQACLSSSLD